jgi:hypothetical protein
VSQSKEHVQRWLIIIITETKGCSVTSLVYDSLHSEVLCFYEHFYITSVYFYEFLDVRWVEIKRKCEKCILINLFIIYYTSALSGSRLAGQIRHILSFIRSTAMYYMTA